MNHEITHIQTPEEQELVAKHDELEYLETDLAQQEMELATLLAELQAFEFLYMGTVGVKIAELDALEASIAEAMAAQNPRDRHAKQAAAEARTQAGQSQTAAEGALETAAPIVPTPELKLLFRAVARSIHPDLSADETELPRRTSLMAQANQAYRQGDDSGLRRILEDWHSAPEAIRGAGVGADLVRVIRRMAQIEKRLNQIGQEMDELEYSDLFQLRLEVEDADADGYDLLSEMAAELDERIAAAQRRLDRKRAQEAKA